MLISARPWESANVRRAGSRIIVPSSLTTSHTTPTGGRPARVARSTAASVCPGRTSTPPSRARSGKMWPGRVRSPAAAWGSASVLIVVVRSAAEMPVVTPTAASTETV